MTDSDSPTLSSLFVAESCRGCGREVSVRVRTGSDFVAPQSEARIRCGDCRTVNSCRRELPDGEHQTPPRGGPEWLVELPEVAFDV